MSLRLDDDEIFAFDNPNDYYAYASGKKPNKKKSSSGSKKKSGGSKGKKSSKKQGSGSNKRSKGDKKKSSNNDSNEVENRKKQLKGQKDSNQNKRNVERKKRQLQGQSNRNRDTRNVQRRKNQLQGQANRNRQVQQNQRNRNRSSPQPQPRSRFGVPNRQPTPGGFPRSRFQGIDVRMGVSQRPRQQQQRGPIQQLASRLKSRFQSANVRRGVTGLVRPNPNQWGSGRPLPINRNDTITLPDGSTFPIVTDRQKGYPLGVQPGMQPVYGNQFVRSGEGGTLETTAPGSRANGVVQGTITIPQGIVGMKDGGADEGTILLKDNHGDPLSTDKLHGPGDMNQQYKIRFDYQKGGQVSKLEVGREDKHPKVSELKGVVYKSQPKMQPGKKLDYAASYQDTKDGGVRLKVFYKNDKGNWEKMVDHVDYGDGGKPYRGPSGVQDGVRIDGRVGGGKPSDVLDQLSGRPINTSKAPQQQEELNKLGQSSIYAREIGPDNSDLHDGIDDPYSFGPRGGGEGDNEESDFAQAYMGKWNVPLRRNIINIPTNVGYW